MSAITVPVGYSGKVAPIDAVDQRYLLGHYHPEARRRYLAVMRAAGGLLGLNPDQGLCGGGGFSRTREQQAASYARDPNTFAPPDRSFHQVWDTWADGASGAQAIDWVGRDGRHAEAWKWLRDFGGLYGIKTFHDVNGEPWHTQLIGVPNSVSQWKAQGYPAPGRWNLPGGTPEPPNPSAPDSYGLWPLNRSKPTIREGSIGDAVRYCQMVCRNEAGQQIAVDGEFGPATGRAVRNVQAFVMGPAEADGIVGPKTWEVLDALAAKKPPEPPVPPTGGVNAVAVGSYWVRPGDSPWRAAERVYGNGAAWEGKFTADQFTQAGYLIPTPGVAGVETLVNPDEGPYALIGRMYPDVNRYEPKYLERFYALNGGRNRVLQPGDRVFLDRM